jgi:predicted Rossmann-fold nucleotide-binding protein
LEGFFEVLTWAQLGIHSKPSGILNIDGYFDGLTGFLDHAVKEGFLTEAHRHAVIVETAPRRLLDRMRAYTPPEGEKLMGRTNR